MSEESKDDDDDEIKSMLGITHNNSNGGGAVLTEESLREAIKKIEQQHYTGKHIKQLHLVTLEVKKRIEAGGDPKKEICLTCGGWPIGFCRIDAEECSCDDPGSHREKKEKPE